uniref:MD-2-related lipid-recognition domain-containing protein n=1 Tax=Strigamia maritima TaxID=126957 RepID=T1J8X6_STRMM
MAVKILLFAIVMYIIFTSTEAKMKYTDCGSKKGIVENVDMVPSCGSVCNLHLGQNVTFTITFKSKENIKSVQTVIHGVLFGMPAPFPLPNPDSCSDGDLTCPLKEDTVYHYVKQFYVEQYYPKLFLNIKYELVDQDEIDIVCVKIPAKIL